MQLHAPEVVDFSKEPEHVKELYGIGEKETDDFGRQLLLARRLVENDVRFIQICHAGGGNGAWDAHGDMKTHAPLCRAVDKPIAGLIRDLKQRGMLDSTLVVFGSEFGRSPWSQNTTGRDHNPKGYTVLAGRRRRQGRHHPRRHRRRRLPGRRESPLLQRPARHDPAPARTRLQEDGVRLLGRTFRLVEEGGGPIKEILG